MKDKLIILIGASGSGKSTILHSLKEKYGFEEVVQYTSRPPRSSKEIDGKDYHFVDDFVFAKEKFLTVKTFPTVFGDWHYGIAEKSLLVPNKTQILVTDLESARKVKWFLGDKKDVHIIFLNPKVEDVMERLKNRGDDIHEVNRRLLADYKDYQHAHCFADYEISTSCKNVTLFFIEDYLKGVGVL